MIKLTDFLKTPNASRTKIKFNMNASNKDKLAWDLLLENDPEWIHMNSWKTQHSNHNLNHADYLIALAQYYPYGPQYYMFGGVYKVKKVIPEVFNACGYELTLLEDYQEYIKRMIIKIDKPFSRDVYNRKYSTIQEQLNPEVYEIAPNVKLGHFPGYQNVSISHKELQQIVKRNEPSWQDALRNVKGVYVITDLSSGQLYIGSASGNTSGIWQRWSSYANLNDPTGGNKGFNLLVEQIGTEHIINNFKYSILEIFDTKTKAETIRERESYWKNVLDTKKHGLNLN
ncbi:GIY-YIG nuclease family protein [Macrococcoides bohemicum]|uniref:GIY-YIG nuclease family protein n=1 Tax=Macrococcoides bohemicum TaxID=1903056 RepID=UPI001C5EAD6E|nr:GIY-YIG nuclease family protein [Macrococcus bohemicus]QYA44818.1 GIY-YIG nuclease family protein [Macrococcus bohemicus]